ncbi:MAG: VanZ family protein [Nitrospirae bacterium]|nr:VanZ family protein [Nitrospirota bacterium]
MHRTLHYKEINRLSAFIYWIFTISYMAAIFFVSSFSFSELPPLPENSDKLIHAVIYLILAVVIYGSLRKSGVNKWLFILSFLLASVYGISDEIHQLFVPGRNATVGDVLADSFGAFLGSYLASVISAGK